MPAITFGGVGSGIDTEKIISGLISASQGPLQQVTTQQAQTQAAISSMSDIGNLLSKLKDSLTALDTTQEVGSFKASSTVVFPAPLRPTSATTDPAGTCTVKSRTTGRPSRYSNST